MIVVDTNIIAYLYISSDHSQHSEDLLSFDSNWVAPILWRSEFRNVLGHYLRKNLLNLDEILLIIQQAEKLLTDHEYEISSAHIMQLVKSSQCSAYDCEFVALAQYLDVPLITADKKILREFPEITKTVESYLT
ncbi:MAG TPA: VapC toxin family PIN domain ribonuclease [Gammaproteobacteria bacterium]|jgi:predicted nucleic acid-binding protein|nr:VapC toxin family PIN domain ribonuclease [Gammaproteobacteria bacterium]